MSRFGEPKPVERIKVLPQKTIRKVASKQTDMSRFGEPKPVERIKVLPQKTIKKVASKQRCCEEICVEIWRAETGGEDKSFAPKDDKEGCLETCTRAKKCRIYGASWLVFCPVTIK